jgi:PBSX family phage portal protein
VNIDGLGFTLDPTGKGDEKDKGRDEVVSFLGNINYDESLTALRMKTRGDLEAVGFSGWQFIRDGKDELAEIHWFPARYLRITKRDDDLTEFEQPIVVDGKIKKVKRRKRFRRFAWVSSGLSADVWYKEFGDPRPISAKDGKVNDSLKPGDADYATEVHMFRLQDQGSAYPVPRWMGALLNLMGARRAEELNYKYFENSLFTPLAILISGGQLSEESVDELKKKLQEGKGWEEAWKFLILEAFAEEPDEATFGEGRSPATRIELKPLIELVKDDALFQKYDEHAQLKGRLAFRLPDILLGLSGEYTRATAEAALSIVNAQVFGTERDEFDDFMNRHVFPRKGFTTHRFRSLSFRASDPEVYTKIIDTLSRIGVLTPATAAPFASEILGAEVVLPDDPYVNHPISLVQTMLQMELLDIDVGSATLDVPQPFRGKSKLAGTLLDAHTRFSLTALKKSLLARSMLGGNNGEQG